MKYLAVALLLCTVPTTYMYGKPSQRSHGKKIILSTEAPRLQQAVIENIGVEPQVAVTQDCELLTHLEAHKAKTLPILGQIVQTQIDKDLAEKRRKINEAIEFYAAERAGQETNQIFKIKELDDATAKRIYDQILIDYRTEKNVVSTVPTREEAIIPVDLAASCIINHAQGAIEQAQARLDEQRKLKADQERTLAQLKQEVPHLIQRKETLERTIAQRTPVLQELEKGDQQLREAQAADIQARAEKLEQVKTLEKQIAEFSAKIDQDQEAINAKTANLRVRRHSLQRYLDKKTNNDTAFETTISLIEQLSKDLNVPVEIPGVVNVEEVKPATTTPAARGLLGFFGWQIGS